MQLRSLLTSVVGVVVAGSAVAYTHTVMKAPKVQQSTRDVVIVEKEIPFGHTIEANMLSIQKWPANVIPDNTFSSINQVIGDESAEPRRAKYALAEGDIVIGTKISEFGEEVSITQHIDRRMRAVTIMVNDITGVAGFIAPSDRIDLTLTRTVDERLVTSTILQDIEVLGVDQSSKGRRNGLAKIKALTVQVNPADAQKLALAQQAGTLSLSLRHIDAADQPSLDSISVGDLTDQVRPKSKKPKRGLPSIVVNRAGQRSTVEVPSG